MAPGGLEALALQLAADLPGDQRIISLDGNTSALAKAWPRLAMVGERLSALGKLEGISPRLVVQLVRIMRRLHPCTVVTHHIGPLLYGGIAARLAGARDLIHVEHDAWHYRSTKRRWLGRIVLNLLRPRLVAVSPAIASELRHLVPGIEPKVIQNGVDLKRFAAGTRAEARLRLGLPAEAFIIGSAGRLEHVKGHDILIEAFARLQGHPILAIAGTGTQFEPLRRLARNRGVADRVVFLGHCDDMAAVYPAFDVFCLPSRFEGLPLAILEAQAAGLASVATNVGAVASALCPGSGIAVPADDPAAMAAALANLRDRVTRTSPRDFIAANFNWRTTLTQYAQLIGA
jgi:glycosyltransferase involved in cell wall biosynthesis